VTEPSREFCPRHCDEGVYSGLIWTMVHTNHEAMFTNAQWWWTGCAFNK